MHLCSTEALILDGASLDLLYMLSMAEAEEPSFCPKDYAFFLVFGTLVLSLPPGPTSIKLQGTSVQGIEGSEVISNTFADTPYSPPIYHSFRKMGELVLLPGILVSFCITVIKKHNKNI